MTNTTAGRAEAWFATPVWDPAPDIAGSKAGGIGEAQLLPSKWNRDNIVGAWRLDVDICEGDELDDGESEEGSVE